MLFSIIQVPLDNNKLLPYSTIPYIYFFLFSCRESSTLRVQLDKALKALNPLKQVNFREILRIIFCGKFNFLAYLKFVLI